MKRLRRWLFNLAAGVSLVLCVASVTFWIRSYWVAEQVYYSQSDKLRDGVIGRKNVALGVSRGGLGFAASGSLRPAAFLQEMGMGSDGSDSRLLKYWSPGAARSYMMWGAPNGCIEDWNWGGFQLGIAVPGKPPQQYTRGVFIVLPLWLVTGLTSILPATRARAIWRVHAANRRRSRGLCPTCGYDLRATPDRCPECGTVAASAKGETA